MKKLISFFEIPCSDFNRAVTFYEVVLGIKLDAYDWGHEKMAMFSDETSKDCGAISWAEDFKPSIGGVLISFNCEEINKALDMVEAHGGKILIPKTKIECAEGYFANFVDSEGNRIGLWSEK